MSDPAAPPAEQPDDSAFHRPAVARRWPRFVAIVAMLGLFGALGHVAAMGTWQADPPPAVATSWQAKLPPLLDPDIVVHERVAEEAAATAPAAGAPEPVAEASKAAEFGEAPGVVEPEALPAPLPALTPPSQLAALTPGPEAAKPEPRVGAPGIGEGPTAAWRLNAVPFRDERGLKLVAIIIDDAGLDRARTARALRLAGPLTISFLPYAPDIQRQAEDARRRGHELMVHLPMEPMSAGENPGPDALTTRIPRDELMRRLALHLGRFDGYVGANNHMGSRMTADANALLPVLEELRDRGLLFVDSRTSKETVAAAIAGHLGMAGTARDVFIDHDESRESVRARLDDIERIAKRVGQAVAIGHPHDRTVEALERWLPTLAERGLTLAPISALVMRRHLAATAAKQ
jgi:polysaccharide deacetylase 2 family uncharacterized protein YibQ